MKAEMNFSIDKHHEIIDLEDFGHEPDVKWEDLSEDDQNEIRDSLTDQMIINCCGSNHE